MYTWARHWKVDWSPFHWVLIIGGLICWLSWWCNWIVESLFWWFCSILLLKYVSLNIMYPFTIMSPTWGWYERSHSSHVTASLGDKRVWLCFFYKKRHWQQSYQFVIMRCYRGNNTHATLKAKSVDKKLCFRKISIAWFRKLLET